MERTVKIKKRLVFFFVFGFLLFLSGCIGQEDMRPKRDCPIEELLLDQSDYPPDTILNDSRSPIAEMPLESAGGSANYRSTAIELEMECPSWVGG
jgi:hypothetical protein